MEEEEEAVNNLVAAAVEDTGRENRDTHSNRRDKSSSAKGSSTSRETKGPKLCYACGKPHPGDCMLRNHPDANTDPSIPWIESKYGKLYGLQIPPGTNLPNTGSIADPNWRNPNPPPNDPFKEQGGDRGARSKKFEPKPKKDTNPRFSQVHDLRHLHIPYDLTSLKTDVDDEEGKTLKKCRKTTNASFICRLPNYAQHKIHNMINH